MPPVPPKEEGEADLICQALVREINRASTWNATIEAWQALLSVRRKEASLLKEREENDIHTGPNRTNGGKTNETNRMG